MLITLGLRSIISPAEYVGTLAIRLDTDNRPECGVRSGQHAGFRDEKEMNQLMPRFNIPGDDESYGFLGVYDYIIDMPERAGENQCLSYHYVAYGWDNGVYVQFPDIWELTLTESSTTGWGLAISRPGVYGLTLILPDYKPGWIKRTPGAKKVKKKAPKGKK